MCGCNNKAKAKQNIIDKLNFKKEFINDDTEKTNFSNKLQLDKTKINENIKKRKYFL
jgi:hypothetical protein